MAWGKLAELCGEYLKKGRQVLVEGKLQTDMYEKDGVKHYTTKIVASNVTFVGGGKGGNKPEDDSTQQPADEDLPF